VEQRFDRLLGKKERKAMDASASWAEIVTALAVMGVITFLLLI
jgi:hypothetical protein